MRCPICKKEVAFDDPNMPFCSDRCREIDLGNWATGKYVIPGPEPFEGQEQELPDELETDEGSVQ
jgi:endogenous inhibitor of DNA gyrase (YacG/DUF329 family)